MRISVATLRRAVFAIALFIPSYGMAQNRCISHDGAVRQLAKKYSEAVVARGLIKGGKLMIELFVSKRGTWTIVSTNTKGASCVMAAGENWFDISPTLVVDPQL